MADARGCARRHERARRSVLPPAECDRDAARRLRARGRPDHRDDRPALDGQPGRPRGLPDRGSRIRGRRTRPLVEARPTVSGGIDRPACSDSPSGGRGPRTRGRSGARLRTGARADGAAEYVGCDDLSPDAGGGVAAARRGRLGAGVDGPRQRLPGQRRDPDPVDARSRRNGCRGRAAAVRRPTGDDRRHLRHRAPARLLAGARSLRGVAVRDPGGDRARGNIDTERPRGGSTGRRRAVFHPWTKHARVAARGDGSRHRARDEADCGVRAALPRARRAARPAATPEARRSSRGSSRLHRIRVADLHRQSGAHRHTARQRPGTGRGRAQTDARRDDLHDHAGRLALHRLHRSAHRPRNRPARSATSGRGCSTASISRRTLAPRPRQGSRRCRTTPPRRTLRSSGRSARC